LETVLCVLHAGGKFGGDDSGYKVSGGLHGVGVSVVNALSEKLTVEVVRDGNLHTMFFEKGVPKSALDVKPVPAGATRGTKVVFKPDPTIFKTTVDMDFDKLATRVDELAYLNPGLTIKMIDKRSAATRRKQIVAQAQADEDDNGPALKPKALIKADHSEESESEEDDLPPLVKVYRHDGGIKELIHVLCADKTNLHPDVDVIYVSEERKGITVEVAMRWSEDQYSESLTTFANGIRTSDGGSHLDGLKASVTRTINSSARKVRF
jgi:DNA gyrase subunit B